MDDASPVFIAEETRRRARFCHASIVAHCSVRNEYLPVARGRNKVGLAAQMSPTPPASPCIMIQVSALLRRRRCRGHKSEEPPEDGRESAAPMYARTAKSERLAIREISSAPGHKRCSSYATYLRYAFKKSIRGFFFRFMRRAARA